MASKNKKTAEDIHFRGKPLVQDTILTQAYAKYHSMLTDTINSLITSNKSGVTQQKKQLQSLQKELQFLQNQLNKANENNNSISYEKIILENASLGKYDEKAWASNLKIATDGEGNLISQFNLKDINIQQELALKKAVDDLDRAKIDSFTDLKNMVGKILPLAQNFYFQQQLSTSTENKYFFILKFDSLQQIEKDSALLKKLNIKIDKDFLNNIKQSCVKLFRQMINQGGARIFAKALNGALGELLVVMKEVAAPELSQQYLDSVLSTLSKDRIDKMLTGSARSSGAEYSAATKKRITDLAKVFNQVNGYLPLKEQEKLDRNAHFILNSTVQKKADVVIKFSLNWNAEGNSAQKNRLGQAKAYSVKNYNFDANKTTNLHLQTLRFSDVIVGAGNYNSTIGYAISNIYSTHGGELRDTTTRTELSKQRALWLPLIRTHAAIIASSGYYGTRNQGIKPTVFAVLNQNSNKIQFLSMGDLLKTFMEHADKLDYSTPPYISISNQPYSAYVQSNKWNDFSAEARIALTFASFKSKTIRVSLRANF